MDYVKAIIKSTFNTQNQVCDVYIASPIFMSGYCM